MKVARRRASFDVGVPAVLAAAIFLTACGSSSLGDVAAAGRTLRWVGLAILLVVSVGWAVRQGFRPRLAGSPYLVALALAALAVVSTAWSVDPRLTLERAVSWCVILVIAAAVAFGAAGRPEAVSRVLAGIVIGAVGVAVAGLIALAVDYDAAAQVGSKYAAWRLRGFGQSPNTMAMLFALALPPAAWLAARASGRRSRLAWGAAALLIAGELGAAQSRGALVAALAGLVVVALGAVSGLQRRVLAVALAVVVVLPGVLVRATVAVPVVYVPPAVTTPGVTTPGVTTPGVTRPGVTRPGVTTPGVTTPGVTTPGVTTPGVTTPGVTTPGVTTPAVTTPGVTTPAVAPPRDVVELPVNRVDEVGHPFLAQPAGGPQSPGLSSGRLEAWRGALRLARGRPLFGFGFGTEDRVFVDRYYFFQGDRPENSYLGFLLQLGGVGLALYLLLLLVAGWVVLRCWRRARAVLREAWVVCLAVLVGGAAIGFFQSFVYSAGNVASLAFWVCVLLPAGTVARGSAGEGSVSAALRWRRRRPTDAA